VELAEKVRNAERNMGTIILAVKARGGYRFRERVPLTGKELENMESGCEGILRNLAVRCVVAEHLLMQLPRSFGSRWDEYQSKLKEMQSLEGR
jgi:hypothetical protein